MKEEKKRFFEQKEEAEVSLRPLYIKDFIGQDKNISNLKVFIGSAKKRGVSLDHVVLSGPPGLGKTTLAYIIAQELNSKLHLSSAPNLSKPADLAKLLTSLGKNDVLFIDEIHSLNRKLEEVLYSAMDDFKIDLIVGEGITAQSIEIPLQPFTLIGATTRSGMISEPLKTRFGIQLRMDYYKESEICKVVQRTAKLLDISISEEAALEISRRSRRTPRVANHLIKRIRDFAEVKNQTNIDLNLVLEALKKMNIDSLGLDEMDRQILSCMIHRYKGKPVGLKSIAVIVGEEQKTLEEIYEPFMVRIGLINRTPNGRIATQKAYEQLDIEYEEESFLL